MNKILIPLVFMILAVLICHILSAETLIYSEDFSLVDPPGWTVLNAGAGNNWSLTANLDPYSGTHHMQYQWDQQFPADTWAFTPGIALTAGYAYHVEFFQRVMSVYYPESMQVTVGPAPVPAAQTTVLLDLPGVNNMDYTNRETGSFISLAGGTYFFGFHCYSPADMYYLFVDLVRIYEYASTAVILDFPYTMDFEDSLFPPEDWSVIDNDAGSTNWTRNDIFLFAHSGDGSAVHNYSATPPGGQDGWLISPSVAVPATGNYFLSFWTFNLLPERLAYNGLIANTTPDPAAPGWEELWSQDDAQAQWSQVAVDLVRYAGMTVYFAFRYQGYNADAWYIDDVRIAELPADDLPPVISHLPLLDTPLADEYGDYIVSAEITDDPFWNNPVSGAELLYSLDGGASWEDPVAMVPGTPPEWSAAIPAQALGTTVSYYISADDIFENDGWSECANSVSRIPSGCATTRAGLFFWVIPLRLGRRCSSITPSGTPAFLCRSWQWTSVPTWRPPPTCISTAGTAPTGAP
ncbi:MAG TPA: choice-of-anchor J domain-containing protein [Candidatus Syntrophosphaera sp.]|nr:choice-of-anchor J domain-containing protein [Candidatus Syntrophosphaera sp.]